MHSFQISSPTWNWIFGQKIGVSNILQNSNWHSPRWIIEKSFKIYIFMNSEPAVIVPKFAALEIERF